MIRVRKAATPPRILRTRGIAETANNNAAHEAAPGQYRSGARKFDFNGDIYAAKSVKNALIKAQYKKCCFCESKVVHVAYGDVEHFRPKGGSRQAAADDLLRPGYYWLAYDWTNLFFSCQLCNQRYKKNLFPLTNPRHRARTHHDDVESEDPLFIDPVRIDPEEHISFRDEVPFHINGSIKGKTTIRELRLDRDELNERRRDRLEMLLSLKDLAGLSLPESGRAAGIVAKAVRDDAEYAAMSRVALE